MKIISLIFAVFILCGCTTKQCQNTKDESLSICQFNMRYDHPNDGHTKEVVDANGKKTLVYDGTNAWPKRLPLIKNFFIYHEIDICGSQELFGNQVVDMKKALGDTYKIFGTTTSPSKTKIGKRNHNNVIFYKASRFELLDSGVFWFSTTPEKESRSWGANTPRNCNWGKFKDKNTGKEFFIFNTHFHHKGDHVRVEFAKLFVKKIKEIAGDNTFYAMGDFNAKPDSNPIKIIKDSGFMIDASKVCKTPLYGSTFTDNYGYTGKKSVWIDWVFISKNIEVEKFAVFSECFDGVWLSDHFPLLLKTKIK